MVNYRRDYTPGATYFFTATLRNRRSNLLTTHIDDLREAFRFAQNKAYYRMVAVVIMPEHLHAIWQLPIGDSDYSRRWRLIKGHFTRSLSKKTGFAFTKDASGEYNLWQKRFWEHRIRDEVDYQRCVDYIHYNPVKHSFVSTPEQWPYSSIHRFIAEGILFPGWGANLDASAICSLVGMPD